MGWVGYPKEDLLEPGRGEEVQEFCVGGVHGECTLREFGDGNEIASSNDLVMCISHVKSAFTLENIDSNVLLVGPSLDICLVEMHGVDQRKGIVGLHDSCEERMKG